ncbi:MAG TPA: helix-turn-helix transcriptional regulator [Vicinamibacterales bacterium]|jgi:DNA-binding transcriptional ArsR family regulator
MNVEQPDAAVARIAAAIGEPARARMLYCLLDGHARTSTELSVVGDVSPSTASVHLGRLKDEQLVMMVSQGKHRYYRLNGEQVADALEALSVIANPRPHAFVPPAPNRLRVARTCYDHMAGTIAVALHDRFTALRWLAASPAAVDAYELTAAGVKAFTVLGIDLDTARSRRRRFAFACLDWSERRPHLGGAMGAAFLSIALKRKWVVQDLDSRALAVTAVGHREFKSRFGV